LLLVFVIVCIFKIRRRRRYNRHQPLENPIIRRRANDQDPELNPTAGPSHATNSGLPAQEDFYNNEIGNNLKLHFYSFSCCCCCCFKNLHKL